MPTQPPRFSLVKAAPRKAWAQPGKNAHRRKRGRAAVEERRRILAEEPLCRSCLANGLTRASEEVDHIEDLPGPEWDARENKQALCRPCHELKTAREAFAAKFGADALARAENRGVDAGGRPTSPDHPWNRRRPA